MKKAPLAIKTPPTIKNFNEVIRANAEIISHNSKLMHSLNNIAECGETAESYMRDLIAEILPSYFQITSSYVVYIRENENNAYKHGAREKSRRSW